MRVENFRTRGLVNRRQEHGFSMHELMVALGIIVIIATFAILTIARARASIRLQSSARTFAGNLEKARIDAIRRRGSTQVDITSSNTYDILMDYNGSGTLTIRRFKLENGVVFTDSNNVALTIDSSGNCTSCPAGEDVPGTGFDKRGRTQDCTMLFRLQNSNGEKTTVQVMGSGDITIDSAVSNANAISYSNVNSSSDVVTTTVVKGGAQHSNFNPCDSSGNANNGTNQYNGNNNCSISVTPTLVTVKRNGGSTQNANVTVNNDGTITATPDSNLSVSPTTRTVTSSSGGTFSFTISSGNRIRGIFPVTFSNSCGTTGLQVKVTN